MHRVAWIAATLLPALALADSPAPPRVRPRPTPPRPAPPERAPAASCLGRWVASGRLPSSTLGCGGHLVLPPCRRWHRREEARGGHRPAGPDARLRREGGALGALAPVGRRLPAPRPPRRPLRTPAPARLHHPRPHRAARHRVGVPRDRRQRSARRVADPWDFEEVYAVLHDFARSYPFDPEREDYLVHITTGTHVAQICLFLLTESRHLPARLLQTSPPVARRAGHARDVVGTWRAIDLDLSRYDRLATRFAQRPASARAPQGRHRDAQRGLQRPHRPHRARGRRVRGADPAHRAHRRGQDAARAAHLRAQAGAAPGVGRLRRGQLRDAARRRHDGHPLRPRQGGLHRRRASARGSCAGRRGRRLPRRDRRARARRAGDAPARASRRRPSARWGATAR
jgi:hypothetical protein